MGTTKIALMSDLHCEFDRYVPEIHPKASLCILAGDIHQMSALRSIAAIESP